MKRKSFGFDLLAVTVVLIGLAALGIAAVRSPSESAPPPLAQDAEAAQDDEGNGKTALWRGDGYRIAAVRNGARVRIYDRPGGKVVATVSDETDFGSPEAFSVLRQKGSWLKVVTTVSEQNDPRWIRANPESLKFLTTDVSVHASLSKRQVELRRDGKVEQRFTVTVGAPGSSTPPGRFAITDVIVGGLNSVYGCCAIVLSAHQEDLPPGWIGGDRVAIHGTTGEVGHASSNGCLRAPNDQARALGASVRFGAPVFITA